MKKIFHRSFSFIIVFILNFTATAQKTIIQGTVFEEGGNIPIPHASVTVKGSNAGTITDNNGKFSLETNTALPLVLSVSSVGFTPTDFEIKNTSGPVSIYLVAALTLGEEIVLVATRMPVSILRSPVTVEKIPLAKLNNIAATSYYDAINNLKGLDATTSGILYKTFSTRGFNLSGSPRVNQLMDGMDNQAPGLNFAIGSFVGLTDLDVESVEVLPGASSVLYGPGGMNGTILINSKDAFKYKGLSAMFRQGIMHVDKNYRDKIGGFSDISLRWAETFKDKFAVKIAAQYVRAIDWLAADSTNYLRAGDFGKTIPGNRQTDPNYDGINVYGDETTVDIRAFMAAALPPNHPLLANPVKVSRTGYHEKDVIDPETYNLKFSGALHYKLTEKLQARLIGHWSKGQTVYTGSNRFAFTDVNLAQYKLELKHDNWFISGYTMQGDAGETYSATTTMQIFNEAWKPSFNPSNINGSWYPQYTGAFLAALQNGSSMQDAHHAARAFADMGRPAAGSAQFKQIFDQVRKIPIPGGGLFIDNSDLWFGEGQYNFSNTIKFAEIIAGFNYKKSLLDSRGTVFIDTLEKLDVSQWGGYVQISKKLAKDVITLSASGRFDKNENFDGRFTPRFTALISPTHNHHFRVSYQTAYRFPTNTDLFLKLNIGTGIYLLGGLPWIVDYMHSDQDPVFKVNLDGSVQSSPYQYKKLEPETSNSFEIGYKSLLKNKMLIDLYFYFSRYENFIGRNILYQPATGSSFSIITNSDAVVKNYGWGFSMDYQLPRQYNLFFAFYSDVITDIPTSFIGGFNTPRYRIHGGFSNAGFGKNKNWGFNLVVKWQDRFLYERDFATGFVKSFATMDAQVNYKLRKCNSMIRIGGTNLTNHYYQNAFGNPMIGGLYYASYIYNLN